MHMNSKLVWASLGIAFLLVQRILADCVVPPVGIVGWWSGDNTTEDVRGLNSGILHQGGSYVGGLVGSAFHFDGIKGAVTIPSNATFNVSNAITLEVWVKHDQVGRQVQRYMTLTPEKAQIRHGGDAGFYFSIKVAGRFYELRSGILPKVGVYHHVAGVYSGTVQSLYIDGLPVASQSVIGTLDPALSSELVLSSTAEPMSGDLDEATIYARALTSTEVGAIYEAGPSGKCKPIKIYQQPESQSVLNGQDVSLHVRATGGDPLTYQWSYNGNLIVGETSADLLIRGADFSAPANFMAVISNPVDLRRSTGAIVTTTNATSRLEIQSVSGDIARMSISGSPGIYCLQTSTNLNDWWDWSTVTNLSGSVIITTQPKAGQAIFYRASSGPCERTVIDATTLHGRVMCGYNGWFRCPGDDTNVWAGWADSGTNMWVHWSSAWNEIGPATLTFDLWPDMGEYGFSERYGAPGFTHADGSQAHLFSSVNRKTIDRHFDWMRDYGIDGVFLERFVVDTVARLWMTNVIHDARAAANRTGRTFAIAYDIGGVNPTNLYSQLVTDWKWMVDVEKITQDSRYLHHDGKPVVIVWGYYTSQMPNAEVGNQIIDFFKADTRYKVTLIGGGDWTWRSHTDPKWASMFRRFDAICPWNVGNYSFEGTNGYANTSYWRDDIAEARKSGMMYLPVIYPGFSWDNLKKLPPGTSKIPRLGGDFFWRQFHDAANLGLDMAFVAMFDEVDEGTAIFKVTNDPPRGAYFGTYEGKPSDWYLRLTGEGTRVLRGERPNSRNIPISP